MRIFYIILLCFLAATAILWLGRFGKLPKKVAAISAACALTLSGILLLLAVLPNNSFYGNVVIDKPQSEKKLIALTFDDGPYPPYTNQLLDLLKEKQVPVTFFTVGKSAARYPDLVRRAQAEGHEIELHAGIHQDLLKLNKADLTNNIAYGKQVLKEITGQNPRYMRPPHGFKDWQVLNALQEADLTAVNWSVIPRDWTNPGAKKIADRVCFDAYPGAIVLLHDGDSPKETAPRDQTIAATAMIIDTLRSEGYEFVTVHQLLKGENK